MTGTADSLVLRCTGMDIKMLEMNIPAADQWLDIIVTTSPLTIREAKIKAAPMSVKGDTVVYHVSQYKEETDRAIADVLKRMPGITVEESGRIAYNGKPINRFYIEGMDMMGKSYGVATNNVRAEDIASIEVYERRQPVKALEDIERTDQAALNLRLKDDARGVWNATVQLGAGYKSMMWNAEGLVMRFAKTLQTLLTYKGNNEGEDVASKEILPFELVDEQSEMLGVRTLSEPSIDRSEYLFNNLHALSANVMSKPRKDLDLVAKATYLKDRQTADGQSCTKYFFSDGSKADVNENLYSRLLTNQANLELKLRNNSSRHYLNETVEFNGIWNDSFGTVGETSQRHKSDKIVLRNNFTDLVRVGSKIFSVLSDSEYARLPERLNVGSFLFSDSAAEAVQKVTSERFKMTNELRFSVNKGNWQFRVTGNANLRIENLGSELSVSDADSGQQGAMTLSFDKKHSTVIPTDSLKNDLTLKRIDFMLNPALEYNLHASFNAAKRFQSLSTTINAGVSWSAGESPIIRQGDRMSVRRSVIQGKLGALTRLSSFLNMGYSCSFSNISSGLSHAESLSSIFLLRQSLVANWSFRKSWNLRGEFEHYRNDYISGKNRNTLFADLSLSYKKYRFEYILIARNLLNRKSFSSGRSTDLIEYSTTRAIRPASVTLKILFNLR